MLPDRLRSSAVSRFFRIFPTAVLLALLLCACGTNRAEPARSSADQAIESSTNQTGKALIATKGETSAGTPIVDRENSAFSISDVSMQDTPDSSCFSQIGYSRAHEILVVTFRDSGSTYLYLDFPSSEWESFRSASSLGSYYNTYIKGVYDCSKYSS